MWLYYNDFHNSLICPSVNNLWYLCYWMCRTNEIAFLCSVSLWFIQELSHLLVNGCQVPPHNWQGLGDLLGTAGRPSWHTLPIWPGSDVIMWCSAISAKTLCFYLWVFALMPMAHPNVMVSLVKPDHVGSDKGTLLHIEWFSLFCPSGQLNSGGKVMAGSRGSSPSPGRVWQLYMGIGLTRNPPTCTQIEGYICAPFSEHWLFVLWIALPKE